MLWAGQTDQGLQSSYVLYNYDPDDNNYKCATRMEQLVSLDDMFAHLRRWNVNKETNM